MAKVFLGVGHGGSDPGAVKYIREKDVNLQMALACRDYLVAHGVQVKMSRTRDENDPLTEEIRECNAYDPDLAVDIHNNAGGGDGFEAYYHYKGGTSKTLALNIEAEVKAIGQNSRGCKIKKNSSGKDYFGFIRQTVAPAVIVEGVFVDNAADAAQADTLTEQQAFGVAYAKGILKTLGIAASASTPAAEPATPAAPAKKDVSVNITLPQIGNGDRGNSVRAMQRLVIAYGYSCGSAGADGIFGAGTERGVRKFQKAKRLDADGICGKDTWTALLK